MLFSSCLRNGKRSAPARGRRTQTSPRQRAGFRPRLEVLEDRTVPSGYQQLDLVGAQPGTGHHTDPNLNGWGMTGMPDGSFVVSNTFSTGLATFYSSTGHVLPQTITVPETANPTALSSAGLVFTPPGVGHPTGVVYNSTNDFVITNPKTNVSAPATLIFDSLDGVLSGWNPCVDPTDAIVIRDTWTTNSPSVYTGLEIGQAIGPDGQEHNVLYAADFLNNDIQIINGSFTTIKTINTAPQAAKNDVNSSVWSVQAVNSTLYVTFADLLGPQAGGGAVDAYDMNGNWLYQLDANAPGAGGRLQNPWGITQAPANFGKYSNDLLVGNVAGTAKFTDDANINVYDPNTHAYLGQLTQPNGAPIAIYGLWDIEFGDGTPKGGKANWLYFDAGPNHPNDDSSGLFGVIKVAGDPSNQCGSQGWGGGDRNGHDRDMLRPSSILSSSMMPISTLPTSTMSPPNGVLEQQLDAILQELDGVLLSLSSNHTAMDAQLSVFLPMLKSSLDARETA